MRTFHGDRWATCRRGLSLSTVMLGLVALGCKSIQVAVGTRTRLADVPVVALKASLPKGPGLGPGQATPLVVVATTQDGRELATEGDGHGPVLWDSFDIQGAIAQVDGHGIVTLPVDPRESEGRLPHLRIIAKGQPGAAAELDIPVRYDCAFVADFSGRPGSSGSRGRDGASGRTGTSGSSLPGHEKPGGRGGNGEDGTNGGSGGRGEPGKAVQVWITLKAGPRPLLQVRVAGDGREQCFLVDPQGGSLLVKTDGGKGGAGGSGGQGGQGGQGGSGWPPGSSGLSGHSGRAGGSGFGGDGGVIHVAVDPQARPYLGVIRFSSQGAPFGGKDGPPPEIRDESVAALW